MHTLVIVAGGPGTGKTYTVTKCLTHVQIPTLRMAPTARVASSFDGQTLHSALRLKWKPGSVLHDLEKELAEEEDEDTCITKSNVLMNEFDCISEPQVVVIDEIGMVPFWLTYWIVQYFFQFEKPILFVVMGDPNQLRPVKSLHNIFSATTRMDDKRIDLVESKRFSEPYQHVIKKLRTFVDANDVTGMMSYICEHFNVVEDINKDVLMKCTRAMAYRKSTVESYNNFYLKYLVEGPLYRLWKKNSTTSKVEVKVGCHVFVIQNGVSSALNGTPLIFDGYEEDKDCLRCKDACGVVVRVHRNMYGEFPIVVGFAGTVHKFQGDTMDDAAIAINFNGSTNLHLIYTALSRVRSNQQIVAIEL